MRTLQKITYALPRATAPSNPGLFGTDWSSHFTRPDDPQHRDHHTRASSNSTQIYHGQARPSHRRGIHSVGQDRVTTTPTPPGHIAPNPSPYPNSGPATGAGTGVFVSAQMFGTEVKGNPTESEADVAADRSDLDPLPPGLHHTIRLGAGDAAPLPTESEADVVADRGAADADAEPLWAGEKKRVR
ncbi:predicted protein [Chaetomium globosum CBS 148.51]|uniref:Uncharacterized protein n=1 Tax=Chaetomium globosum (strain ATCC 6205 / CBS 148.51 / DSM 1962 / NBRC 6347 / NRRL 1970) TaxID=306901 RepID=Q2HCJ5_CHAGB|nr:uncharacterized protein CHGG_02059 [Chaetomium globosum CBS 148.51]EAQ93824.1 predicted protein [Chaetomium globosum CBS 148.51]